MPFNTASSWRPGWCARQACDAGPAGVFLRHQWADLESLPSGKLRDGLHCYRGLRRDGGTGWVIAMMKTTFKALQSLTSDSLVKIEQCLQRMRILFIHQSFLLSTAMWCGLWPRRGISWWDWD